MFFGLLGSLSIFGHGRILEKVTSNAGNLPLSTLLEPESLRRFVETKAYPGIKCRYVGENDDDADAVEDFNGFDEEDLSEEPSDNRTFWLVAGILGAILILALVCMVLSAQSRDKLGQASETSAIPFGHMPPTPKPTKKRITKSCVGL